MTSSFIRTAALNFDPLQILLDRETKTRVNPHARLHSGRFPNQKSADRFLVRGCFDANDSFIFGHQVVRPSKKFARNVPMWTQSREKVYTFLKVTYPVLNLGATSKVVRQAIEKMPKRQRGIAEREVQRAAIAEIVLRNFYIHMMRQGTIANKLRRTRFRFPLGRKNKLEIVRNVLKKIREYKPATDYKQ